MLQLRDILFRTFQRLTDEAAHAKANPDYYWRCVKLNAFMQAMEIAKAIPRTAKYHRELEKRNAA